MTEMALDAVGSAALATRINTAHEACRASLEGGLHHAIEVGELLTEAKRTRDPAQTWTKWAKGNLAFGHKQAAQYMLFYRNKDRILADYASERGAGFRQLLRGLSAQNRTSPEETDVDPLVAGELQAIIASGTKFRTIYADPPWKYSNQATRAATDRHYPTMTPEKIAELPIGELVADDAHLHLWTTNAFLFDAKAIIEAWGFEYKSVLVWVKPQMGIGNYWRVSHEFLLLGVRGKAPFKSHGHMSWLEAERLEHSQKPEAFRNRIEDVGCAPRIELFARMLAPGWTAWGNDIRGNLPIEVIKREVGFDEYCFGSETKQATEEVPTPDGVLF